MTEIFIPDPTATAKDNVLNYFRHALENGIIPMTFEDAGKLCGCTKQRAHQAVKCDHELYTKVIAARKSAFTPKEKQPLKVPRAIQAKKKVERALKRSNAKVPTIKELSDELGLTEDHIQFSLRKNLSPEQYRKYRLLTGKITMKIREELKQKLDSGETLDQYHKIASHYGVDRQVIHDIIGSFRKNGVTIKTKISVAEQSRAIMREHMLVGIGPFPFDIAKLIWLDDWNVDDKEKRRRFHSVSRALDALHESERAQLSELRSK